MNHFGHYKHIFQRTRQRIYFSTRSTFRFADVASFSFHIHTYFFAIYKEEAKKTTWKRPTRNCVRRKAITALAGFSEGLPFAFVRKNIYYAFRERDGGSIWWLSWKRGLIEARNNKAKKETLKEKNSFVFSSSWKSKVFWLEAEKPSQTQKRKARWEFSGFCA